MKNMYFLKKNNKFTIVSIFLFKFYILFIDSYLIPKH